MLLKVISRLCFFVARVFEIENVAQESGQYSLRGESVTDLTKRRGIGQNYEDRN